jgi:Zn-dependent M28 family amino/carboxypeptidase
MRRFRKMSAAAAAAGLLASVAVVAAPHVQASAACNRTNNTVDKLLECVTADGVMAHQQALQTIADANGDTRASGTPGYDASADYVAATLRDAGYSVTVQPFDFNAFLITGPATLRQVAPGQVDYVEDVDYGVLAQTDPGSVTAPVTAVDLQLGVGNTSTSGCEAADFAGFPAGHIALIQRGTCTFELKGENAAAAGAVGVIFFNQGNTTDSSRTGIPGVTMGNGYTGGIPNVGATYALGVELASTPGLQMNLVVDVVRGVRTTYNVIAESQTGNPGNVVMAGAHLDSVGEGPGINDNGSGSAVLLETAVQMAKVNPRNQVRFAWWGAEESGLVGSNYYVNDLLANAPDELDDIALYLNFDMVASPNYGLFVYDGDGSGFGLVGPDGSDDIEALFEQFYADRDIPSRPTAFSGRSDYQAFINNGIPAGGLFTGAEGIKTAEEAALWGGTAGVAYDPCYHQACDSIANVNVEALDINADAIAFAVLSYAMNTEPINAVPGKGNFRRQAEATEVTEALATA